MPVATPSAVAPAASLASRHTSNAASAGSASTSSGRTVTDAADGTTGCPTSTRSRPTTRSLAVLHGAKASTASSPRTTVSASPIPSPAATASSTTSTVHRTPVLAGLPDAYGLAYAARADFARTEVSPTTAVVASQAHTGHNAPNHLRSRTSARTATTVAFNTVVRHAIGHASAAALDEPVVVAATRNERPVPDAISYSANANGAGSPATDATCTSRTAGLGSLA